MVTRRVFLIASAGVVTAYGGADRDFHFCLARRLAEQCMVARGKKGIPAGTSSAPSQAGEWLLLDGTHFQLNTSGHIRPNRSVLLS